MTQERRKGAPLHRMVQVHYIYRVLYFCYYNISSTSEHQALDHRVGTQSVHLFLKVLPEVMSETKF